jgi:hypothetical protein
VSTAERIDDFIAATRELASAPAFVARFPHPFLVHEATDGAPSAPPQDRRTAKVSRVAPPAGDGFGRGDVSIHRLRPRDPAQDEGVVTLGRDDACDVVVDDPTVSLIHARFSVEGAAPVDPDGAPDDDDDDDGRRFYVADAHSSNGTYVDGVAVARGARARVVDPASLRFGPQAKFQFFTAAGFFQFLDLYRRIKRRGS